MKQITATFQPHRLEHVEQALPPLPGFTIASTTSPSCDRGVVHV